MFGKEKRNVRFVWVREAHRDIGFLVQPAKLYPIFLRWVLFWKGFPINKHAIVSLGSFETGWPRLAFSICDTYRAQPCFFSYSCLFCFIGILSAPRSLSSSEFPRCYSVDASPDSIPKPTYADLRMEEGKRKSIDE